MKPKLLDENWRPLEFQSGNSIPVKSKIMTEDMVKSIIQQTEEATLTAVMALMHKQQPLAWMVDRGVYSVPYTTTCEAQVKCWEIQGLKVKPLYTIPEELNPNQLKKKSFCPNCYSAFIQEKVSDGYVFECKDCDEDFFGFDVNW